jgi:hypothetical protein
MNRLLSGITLIGLMLAGSQSFSLDLTNQSAITKKQISACMTKRMLANRAVSYNDAKKSCTEQLNAQNVSTASNRSPHVDLSAASGPGLAR